MPNETTDIKQVNDSEIDALLNMGNVETKIEDSTNPLAKNKDVLDTDLGNLRDIKKLVVDDVEAARLAEEKASADKAAADKLKAAQTTSFTDEEAAAALNLTNTILEVNDDDDASEDKVGNPTVFVNAIKDLVKDETIFLFDEEEGKERTIDQYSKKEIVEVVKANIDRVKKEEAVKAPKEFFDALPEEMQYAATYVANGGKELKKVFRYLAEVEEVKEIDTKTPEGQERAIRLFLTATNFGTPEEIEEELTSIKDLPGALEKKSNQFKPKLEAIKQQNVEKEIKAAEATRKAEEAALAKYREGVHNTVAVGELEGLKLTPTTQGMIYNEMVKALPGFQELLKATGIKTNLTHLAKVCWLLKDPKGYDEAVKASAVKDTNTAIARTLKTEAANKVSASNIDTTKKPGPAKTVPRKANIFSRT